MLLNFDESKLDLSNDVHLLGGEVSGFDNVFRPQQLLGDLYVSGDSRIAAMNVVGTTHLNDGSRLTTYNESVIKFLGDINVKGHAEFQYGSTLITNNAAGVAVGTVQLLGRVVADDANSVLDFVNLGLDRLVLDVTYHAESGQTLQILNNGLPSTLSISGQNSGFTGGGTLLNPVRFEHGGSIRPAHRPALRRSQARPHSVPARPTNGKSTLLPVARGNTWDGIC